MAIRLNSNVQSLTAQRYLTQATSSISKSFERLSSGLRVNTPSDDAAGLSVASSLAANSRINFQGIRNVNDGISLLSIAEGSLQGLSSIVTRQLELAEQSANGAVSLNQRRALDAESEALRLEFNRIVQTTQFNGLKMYDGSLQDAIRMQAGIGTNGGIAIQLADELDYAVGNGTLAAQRSFFVGAFSGPRGAATADLNGDGILDLVTAGTGSDKVAVLIGNGDGTFKAFVSYQGGATNGTVAIGDVTGDGIQDLVVDDDTGPFGSVRILQGNGNGTFKASVSYQLSLESIEVRLGDLNGDGKLDIVAEGYTTGQVAVLLNNGNGTFGTNSLYTVSSNTVDLELLDVNGDGRLDVVTTGDAVGVILGNGNGSFSAVSLFSGLTSANSLAWDDLNYDGIEDLVVGDYSNGTANVFIGNGNGTFKARVSYQFVAGARSVNLGDFNGDGYSDIVQVYSATGGSLMISLGNGDGTFKASTSRTTVDSGFAMALGDYNGDGVTDVAIADDASGTATNSIGVHLTNTVDATNIGRFSILTQDRARNAIPFLRTILNRIDGELGLVGAGMQRLGSAARTLDVCRVNFDAAYSQIMDADVASEVAQMTRNQILQQSATAILAQANQIPSIALLLLK